MISLCKVGSEKKPPFLWQTSSAYNIRKHLQQHEEIGFQRGILFFVIEQLISLLDERFSYHVLIEGSLINTQVLIGS